MNADSVNRWLTLSANIGVLIGLILLIIELDQNSDLVRAQIHQSRSDAHVGHRLDDSEDEHMPTIWIKLRENGYPSDTSSVDVLTPIELHRYTAYIAARHTDLDNLFYQYQQGFFDEEFYSHKTAWAIRLNAPYWRKLNVFQQNVRPSFAAEIERIMQEYGAYESSN
jgi:hypothetical protein